MKNKILQQPTANANGCKERSCRLLAGLTALVAVCASALLTSCTATRVVTTSASYVQHGDTTTTIMTKTTETYRGEKQL